jgi:GcrA cell cycle regulator
LLDLAHQAIVRWIEFDANAILADAHNSSREFGVSALVDDLLSAVNMVSYYFPQQTERHKMNSIAITSTWTEERHARLEELYREGWTSSQIGAELGCSRNAVIGRIMRSGLREKGYEEGYRVKPTPTVRAAQQRQRLGVPRVKRKSYVAATLETVAYLEPSHPKKMRLIENIVDLKSNSCRFPIGDPCTANFAYCGNDAMERLPYCPHHTRIAYSPPQPRRKQEVSYGPKV